MDIYQVVILWENGHSEICDMPADSGQAATAMLLDELSTHKGQEAGFSPIVHLSITRKDEPCPT